MISTTLSPPGGVAAANANVMNDMYAAIWKCGGYCRPNPTRTDAVDVMIAIENQQAMMEAVQACYRDASNAANANAPVMPSKDGM